MTMFVVELVYAGNRDERLAVRPAHREYLTGLATSGKLLAAGPWADETGAVMIFDVGDRAELDAILRADPYTPARVVAQTRVREWAPVVGGWLAPG